MLRLFLPPVSYSHVSWLPFETHFAPAIGHFAEVCNSLSYQVGYVFFLYEVINPDDTKKQSSPITLCYAFGNLPAPRLRL